MVKKKWKMIVLTTIVSLMVMFNFTSVFATDTPITTENTQISTDEVTGEAETQGEIMPISEGTNTAVPNATNETTDETTSEVTDEATGEVTDETTGEVTDQDIYSDDLYIVDNNVVMDKLVDGNVYILADTAEITGQVNGNLYICANKITFKGSYIRYSIYACASTIEFDGACNDLYAVCNNLNVSYDSYVVRDVRLASGSVTYAGLVGRNAYIKANTLGLTITEPQKDADGNIVKDENGNDVTEEKSALIYGNLNYFMPSEITVPDGVVEGTVNYTNSFTNSNNETSVSSIIYHYVINLLCCLVFTLVVFFLIRWLTPKFEAKSAEFVSSKMVIGLGIGVVSIIAAILIALLLAFSIVGVPLTFAFIAGYALLISIGFAIVSICIANKFAKDGKLLKKLGNLLIVTIILWALTQIPYAGDVIKLIITFTGVGIALFYSFTKNKVNKENKENEETKKPEETAE